MSGKKPPGSGGPRRKAEAAWPWLSALTYGGAATAVLAHDQPLSRMSLLQPHSTQDLVAVLGLGVACASLVANTWLRWASWRLAKQSLALAQAQLQIELERAAGSASPQTLPATAPTGGPGLRVSGLRVPDGN